MVETGISPCMKILLVQTAFLGDLILSTPVIAGIHAIYPNSEIWVLISKRCSGLLDNDPRIKGIIEFDKRGEDSGIGFFNFVRSLKSRRFDIVYSLHKSYRTSILLFLSAIPKRIGFVGARLSFLYTDTVAIPENEHSVVRHLSILGGSLKENAKNLPLSIFPPALENLSPKIRSVVAGLGRFAVIAPGSEWATKRWYAKGYKEVVQYLISSGVKVLVVGNTGEKEICSEVGKDSSAVNLAGDTTIQDILWLVNSAVCLICNDSMILHLGSAFKVPTVSIFCSTSPTFGFGPWQNRSVIVEKKGLSCKPCGPHGYRSCPIGTEECMRELSSMEVIKGIEELGIVQ